MLALRRRQLLRQLHVHRCVEIAHLVRLPGGRHTMTLQPKHLPVLGRGRDTQPQLLPAERLDVCLAAEYGGRQRHRYGCGAR